MFPCGKHSNGPLCKHGLMPLSFRGLVYLSVEFSSFQPLQSEVLDIIHAHHLAAIEIWGTFFRYLVCGMETPIQSLRLT